MEVSWYVTLCTAVVGTVWPLLGLRSRHGPATPRLTLERPGNVIPVPKTFTLLAVRCLSQCDAASLYLLAIIYCVVCLNFLTLHFATSLKEPDESCEEQNNI